MLHIAEPLRVSAIVLAAGKSERMGRHKLLLPFAGGTVIGSVLDGLLQSRAGEVILVTGHNADGVREAVGDRVVRIAHNAGYEEGMLSSVLRGLDEVSQDADAVLMALGDQPGVPPRIIDRIIDAYAASDKGLAVPTCHHEGRLRRGHPVVLHARYVPEIRDLSGGQGLRELFVRHADDTEFVPFDTPLVVDDLDTPEDYERLLQREVR
jgi:molybdenum cofactor cytidylyltransferase